MAIPIALLHFVVVNAEYFVQFQGLYFIPITLLVVPVVYAALTFGFAGSVGTAVWVVILTIPNLIFGLTGFERLGEIFQLVVLVTMAIFIGQKVDREIISRNKLEAANSALSASEKKYRGLFDSSPLPIIIIDNKQTVIEANPSAGILFNKSPATIKGLNSDLLGIKIVNEHVFPDKKENWWETNLVTIANGSSEVYLEPTFTAVNDIQGNSITQIMLRDVTVEHQREVGLKAYTAHVIRVQEEERHRIARELHDETIQTLALLCRQLDNIDFNGDGLSANKKLVEARDIAEKAVKDLRDFTRGLRPPILDDLGVVASIRRLLVDFMDRTHTQGQFKIIGKEERLFPDVEVGLYRIAQEALWNIERHAKATRVIISITFTERETTLDVADDGVGFNVPAVIGVSFVKGHLGLVGMQERAALFGGELKIKSQAGKGTTVTVSIPCAKNALVNLPAGEPDWPDILI